MTAAPAALLARDVDLLCLDAGNTVIFFDHERVAAFCVARGFTTTAGVLERAEGATKIAMEHGEELDVAWSHAHLPSARGWGRTVATILSRAGLPGDRVVEFVDALWTEHVARNLWTRVPEGLVTALARARAAGAHVAIVSNSEGKLEALFADLGILDAFDLVIDSGVVGVEKPDPRIFRIALGHFGVGPERALHLGDNFTTDVVGARAAGMRAALIDPFGHLDGRHADVPRVEGVREMADAIADARGRARGRH